MHGAVKSKLLGKGTYGCAVTNVACNATAAVYDKKRVASKILFDNDKVDSKTTLEEEKAAASAVKAVDPEGLFSVAAVGNCKKKTDRYPDSVKAFCHLEKDAVVTQVDSPFGGVTVQSMLRDYKAVFEPFLSFMTYVHNMHVRNSKGHFDLKSDNVVYDRAAKSYKLIDWATMGSKPPENFMDEPYFIYPPETAYVFRNDTDASPPTEDEIQTWLKAYRKSLDTISHDTGFKNDMMRHNSRAFRRFVQDPANARVFAYSNEDLWNSAYLQRIDAFGLGMVVLDLVNLCMFVDDYAFNHIRSMAAYLMSAVPSLTEYPLLHAIEYLTWILGPHRRDYTAVRDPKFDAVFPVFPSTPITDPHSLPRGPLSRKTRPNKRLREQDEDDDSAAASSSAAFGSNVYGFITRAGAGAGDMLSSLWGAVAPKHGGRRMMTSSKSIRRRRSKSKRK